MDFDKKVIQPIVGFCFFCIMVGGIIKTCSDSDKSTYSSTPTTEYQSYSNPSPLTDSDPDSYPEWEDYWYDDPFCNGTGNCHECEGAGKWEDVEGIIHMCLLCNGTGKCTNCGGQGQCKGVRQVN